jgi:4-amino-4-deoxy-L-arabinose transferase-like glycosyltransferase
MQEQGQERKPEAASFWPTPAEWRLLLPLLGLGLALRVALILSLRTYVLPERDDHWYYGFEYGRIARSLALGKGYASPFYADRGGPTTLGVPLFPFYLSLLFRAFGVYSSGAALAMHLTNSAASLLTALLVFLIGKRLFGSLVGGTAAVLFTFDPLAVWYSTNAIWETSLSALGMTLLMAVFLRLRDRPTVRAGVVGGLVAGVVAHVHVVSLLVDVTCGLWLLARSAGQRRQVVGAVAVMALVTALCITPWSVRNSLIEGGVVVVRGWPSLAVHYALDPRKESYTDSDITALTRETAEMQARVGEGGLRRWVHEQAEGRPRITLGEYLRHVGIRTVRFWFGELWATRQWSVLEHVKPPSWLHWVKVALHSVPTLLAAAGFVLAWRRREDVWLPFAQVAGFFPVYGLLHCRLTRYRFPIEATLLLLGACALRRPVAALWARVRRVPS